jgi:hypothetical protein
VKFDQRHGMRSSSRGDSFGSFYGGGKLPTTGMSLFHALPRRDGHQ